MLKLGSGAATSTAKAKWQQRAWEYVVTSLKRKVARLGGVEESKVSLFRLFVVHSADDPAAVPKALRSKRSNSMFVRTKIPSTEDLPETPSHLWPVYPDVLQNAPPAPALETMAGPIHTPKVEHASNA